MIKEIEELIKIQGVINKRKYHLCIDTDLEKNYRWVLFLYNPNIEDYFSSYNRSIMDSKVDSIEDLKKYLEKHDGFDKVW